MNMDPRIVEDVLAKANGHRAAAPPVLNDGDRYVPGSQPAYDDLSANCTGPAPDPAEALTKAHTAFSRWLGEEYDRDALDATLITAAVERLNGDPLWLLVISGSGNAKTETVGSLAAVATVTSTVSSEGALLSATSRKERAKDATGGLLRKLGDSGVLVIKDVTSVLSMDRTARASVLAALREIYDGQWSRNVGTDGGRTLDWAGRIAVIGAVTTAWDRAHSVISAMGDRFVLIRMDSHKGRLQAGRRAIGNTGSEVQMRAELSEATAAVLAAMSHEPTAVTDEETEFLLAAANLVTLARTAVDHDYQGNVIDAHAPEMPTRFAKQLAQIVRGGMAIGMDRAEAMRLAIRCARDSMPPMRLAIIDDVAANPGSTSSDTRRRIDKPRTTVDREMQALHMLGVLTCAEEPMDVAGRTVTRWKYRLAEGIEPEAINTLPFTRNVVTPTQGHREECPDGTSRPPSNKSGEGNRPKRRFCPACGGALNPALVADGETTHPGCDPEGESA